MRLLICVVVLFLGSWGQVALADVRVLPSVGVAGESVLVRWDGPTPLMAVMRVEQKLIYLTTDSQGAWGVIGLDIDREPIPLGVELAVLGGDGESRFYQTQVDVVRKERPKEYLTLPERMVSPKKPKVLARIKREYKTLQGLYRAADGPALWRQLLRPVADPVSSIFGVRRILNGQPRSPHGGTDFRSPTGTPVKSTAEGRVVLAASLYYTGKTVVVDHGGGLISLYAHLSQITCKEGDQVAQGQVVGKVGSTGRSTGPHLHWSLRWFGARIDGMQLIDLTHELP